MGDKGKMKIVNTSTACVKMTSGVPVNKELMSDSASDSEDEGGGNHSFKNNNSNLSKRNDSGVKENNSPKSASSQQSYVPNDRVKDPKSSTASQIALPSSQMKDQKKVLLQSSKLSKENTFPSKDLNNSGNTVMPNDYDSSEKMQSKNKQLSSSSKDSSTKNSSIYIPKKNNNSQSDKFTNHSSYTSSDNSSEFTTEESLSSQVERNQPQKLSHSQSLENKEINSSKGKGAGLVTSTYLHSISDVKNGGQRNHSRVNPFNNDMHVDEDHFSDRMDNFFRAERRSTGSTKSCNYILSVAELKAKCESVLLNIENLPK